MKSSFIRAVTVVMLPVALALIPHLCAAQPEHESFGEIEFNSAFVDTAEFLDKNDKSLNAEVETWSADTEISLSKLKIGYKYTSYQWSQPDRLPFGSGKDGPWTELHDISAGFHHSGMFNPEWGYFFGAGASSQFEKEISASYSGSGFAGLFYNVPEWRLCIRVGGGASVNEVESEVMAMGGIEWNGFAETGLSIALGIPDTHIAYRFTPESRIRLGLTMNKGLYRLADDSPVEKEGYLETERFGGFLEYELKPADFCKLSLGGAFFFDREYRLYDKDGNDERVYDLDDAGGGFASISFMF